MDKLAAKQTKDGWVDGATETVVGSRGEALQIETTSLATLAWSGFSSSFFFSSAI